MSKLQYIAYAIVIVFVSMAFLYSGGVKMEKATFAGGCFWCMVYPFERIDGVQKVVVGYTGGDEKNPTYEEVAGKMTDHVEAVQVTFDPGKVSYKKLLDVYWKQIDPTDAGGQFADRGDHYKTYIFYHSDEQKEAAQKSKKALDESGKFKSSVVTEIVQAKDFYPAEEYHQQYYLKNPMRYKMYKKGSGRQGFIEENWGTEK